MILHRIIFLAFSFAKAYDESYFESENLTYQQLAVDCIKDIVTRYLYPTRSMLTFLTSRNNISFQTSDIQNQILIELHNSAYWFLETIEIGEEQALFESAEIPLNISSDSTQGHSIHTKRNFVLEYKSSHVVLIVDSLEVFAKALVQLTNDVKSFSSSAKHLIYFSEFSDNSKEIAFSILKDLWINNIYKAVVVIPVDETETWNTYRLKGYEKSQYCGEKLVLDLLTVCKNEKITRITKVFIQHLPRRFNNCTTQVLSAKYPPYVTNETNGFEIKLINAVGKALDMNFEIIINNTLSWGTKDLDTNTWSGRLGMLINSTAIAFGSFQATEEFIKDFDVSVGYFHERLNWVVPAAEPIPNWLSTFVIFSVHLWIMCVAIYVMGALFLYLSSFYGEDRRKFRSFKYCSIAAIELLLGQGVRKTPNSILTRSIFMSILILNLILTASYQCFLIYHMTHTTYYSQIKTVEGILESDLTIAGSSRYKSFFNVSEDPLSMKIFDVYKITSPEYDTAYNWLKAVASTRKIATILGDFYVKYLIALDDPALVTKDNYVKVFIVPETIMFYPVRLIVKKGHPLLHRIDQILMRFQSAGLIKSWVRRASEKVKKAEALKGKYLATDSYMPIKIEKIQGAFMLLCFGYAASLVVFILELIFYKVKKQLEQRRVRIHARRRISPHATYFGWFSRKRLPYID